MGRGIRVGLARCDVCGSAHEGVPGDPCGPCLAALAAGDRAALVGRSMAFMSGRFGPHVAKDPPMFERVVASAVDRRIARSSTIGPNRR